MLKLPGLDADWLITHRLLDKQCAYLIAIETVSIVWHPQLVEIVLVQLAHKALKVGMLKVLWQNVAGKFVGVFDHKCVSLGSPRKDLRINVVLQHATTTR